MNGDFTLTAPIASSELRAALVALAGAMVDAEEAIAAVSPGMGLGIAHMKPESAPPKGNTSAARLCRRICREVNDIVNEVAIFESNLDPAYRTRSQEHRVQVREIRRREREDTVARLREVYGLEEAL